MNEQVTLYLQKYPLEIIEMFHSIRKIVFEVSPTPPREIMWAQIPSYS